MRNGFKVIIAFALCVMLLGIISIAERQMQFEDRISQTAKPEIEEPVKITGKFQIILFQASMIPSRAIKTSSFFVKEKIIGYADHITAQDLPLQEGAMIIPDDDRDIEQYGVFDVETFNTIYE